MRIGINTLFHVPGDVGGMETFLRRTLRAMAECSPKYTLVLFTSLDNDSVLRDDLLRFPQIEFVRLKFRASKRPLRILMEQCLLPLAVAKSKVDVLWSPGYTAPALCSCPQVLTVPDLQYKSHPDDMSVSERITLDTLVKAACRRCRAVITISEFSRSEVVRYNFAPADKVQSVHLGVDEKFAVPASGENLPEGFISSCKDGKPYILCVAHTYPHKNVHLLVEAYANIQDKIQHDLVVVGKPRRGENLVSQSMQLVNDPGRVHRLQGLDFSSLRYLFQTADFFVLPSAYEGFGLPVLEAMMSGTLVITSNKASIPEVGGNHVLYCDPMTAENLAAKILEALSLEQHEREAIQSAARLRAASFTWEKTARETMRVLQDTASN